MRLPLRVCGGKFLGDSLGVDKFYVLYIIEL